jgi:hypothetical protein
VHHDRKGQGGNGNGEAADSARGASSLLGVVRTARHVRVMSADEAAKLGVPESERRQCLCIESAKSNLALQNVAAWARLTPMQLGNGDVVAAVERWSPPGALDDIEADDLDQVVAWLAANGPQRESSQAPGWFGWQVATLCGLPGASGRTPGARTKAAAILDTLARQGRIRRTTVEVGRKDRPLWEAVAGDAGPAAE